MAEFLTDNEIAVVSSIAQVLCHFKGVELSAAQNVCRAYVEYSHSYLPQVAEVFAVERYEDMIDLLAPWKCSVCIRINLPLSRSVA